MARGRVSHIADLLGNLLARILIKVDRTAFSARRFPRPWSVEGQLASLSSSPTEGANAKINCDEKTNDTDDKYCSSHCNLLRVLKCAVSL